MTSTLDPIRYGSVCSGIEAVAVAWRPLGLTPAWLSEVDPFANAVLAHHYPHIPNLGDMTQIARAVLAGEVCAPDILVGGTPCQSFSVAGMRKGLADARGALTLKYVELANAIDEIRSEEGQRSAILVWENVPGVLSDRANAFGCLLGAISGEECALRPAGLTWTHAGCVYGPQRSVAWRVLDAQYFGLAQRRKRVFLVASARTDFDPAAVLFECDGVRRDTPPGPQARQGAAGTSEQNTARGGDVEQNKAAPSAKEAMTVCFGGGNASGPIERAACLTARGHKDDFEVETFAVQSLSGAVTHPLTCAAAVTEDGNGRGLPIVGARCAEPPRVETSTGPVARALDATNNGRGSSEDRSGRGIPIISMSFQLNANPALAFAQNSRGEVRFEGGQGQVVGSLSAGGGIPGQGFPTIAGPVGTANLPTLEAHLQCRRVMPGDTQSAAWWQQWRVRRLMPVECERLQGLPDNYTLVTYRGKPAADGPRYKAVGNSMAVPCVAWIGQRLAHEIRRRSVSLSSCT